MGPALKSNTKLSKLFNNLQVCRMKNIKAIIFDLGAVILNINYQNTIDAFSKLGIKRFFLSIFLISILFIFISFFQGIENKGSVRWVNIFGYTLQPSEFLKVSLLNPKT